MRFFVDECLSPRLAHWLAGRGFDAIRARDVGRLGERDDTVRDRCIAEDRIIVTQNAGDFRRLVGRVELHPGLIILPATAVAVSISPMTFALAHIESASAGNPRNWTSNRVVEIDEEGRAGSEALPPA